MSVSPAAKAVPRTEPVGRELDDPLLDCLVALTRLHGRPVSAEALLAGLPRLGNRTTPELFVRAAERQGYVARVLKRRLSSLTNLILPAVLVLAGGRACVLTRLDGRGSAEVILPETGLEARSVPLAQLREEYSGHAILVQPERRGGVALDEELVRPLRSWFWGVLWRFRRYYAEAMVAAVLVNVLALASSLYIMNVYDRVVPNNALDTLVVLAVGMLLAMGIEFLARNLRGYFLDVAGKKADLLLAGGLFYQALGLRMESRPASSGAFSAQLKEFESLRDFITSATLTTVSDLPFVFFFIWVISLIGGPLYLVPLLAVPVVVMAGLIAQVPLARLMRQHLKETTLRHGVLVESVEGMETLKTLCAEGRMQGRWENYTALTGRTATQSRLVSSLVVNFAQLVQQFVTVAVVFWGVHLIGEGLLTVGALIACVILSGRGLAPLGQVAGLLVRYQHARAAYVMLGQLMSKPVERPRGRTFLHQPRLKGAFTAKDLTFAYPEQKVPALQALSLNITAGERVAVLGRMGSGKSTLLRLAAGLYQPEAGSMLVDGLDLQQIDPVDLRRNIGFVSQSVTLFSGTLRENLALGAPLAEDQAIVEVVRLTGLDRLIAQHPLGLDLQVGERGEALSGGQRQAVGMARALLRRPAVYLLDEPTSSMDHNSEQVFLDGVRRHMEGRTLILVTHKVPMLTLVERIVVLDAGRLVADGPRDEVLRALSAPQAPPVAEGGG